MSNRFPHILIVDDQEINIYIIKEYLEDEEYILHGALDGNIALQKLEAEPDKYDVVLLDRMMPNLDGLEVLRRIKSNPQLEHLPVILQTAMARKEEIQEGIRAGAYYYLTKPFDEDELLSIVQTAVHDATILRNLRETLAGTVETIKLMDSGTFHFQTLAEATSLASLLAKGYPAPQKAISGIRELLINAVEHGNLAISYKEKTQLTNTFTWEKELDRRLELPENKVKFAKVEFKKSETNIRLTITDQGNGFNWQEYLDVAPERIGDNHGRGIAMAKLLSFTSLEFTGCGNVVIANYALGNS